MQSNFINVPVFHPNEDEFKNFYRMIRHIETSPETVAAGLAKIVPPVKMTPKTVRNDFILKKCVTQSVTKLSGIYMMELQNETNMTLKYFRDVANKHSSNAPNEDLFWNEIMQRNDNPPIYAIDNEKSLYPNEWPFWKMNELNPEHSIIHDTKFKFNGINTSYLNFGMEFTTFAIHTEDSNLGSINILHGGMPKVWYGVPFSNASKVENVVKLYTPKSIQCELLIRHKSILIPPAVLEAKNIDFSKVIQNAGEIILTSYNGYHQGFNMGYNYSESTNYATSEWLKYYYNTTNCSCDPYGIDAKERHSQLGTLIDTWQQNNRQSAQPENDIHSNERNHWVKFDEKTSRSRCKMANCDGFTHGYCTKCKIHLCCSLRRNCFRRHHETDTFEQEIDHWIEFDEKTSRSRCKMANCDGFTHGYCTKCEVHLCCSTSRNCFFEYHNE